MTKFLCLNLLRVLPAHRGQIIRVNQSAFQEVHAVVKLDSLGIKQPRRQPHTLQQDRKSTRLNSSHGYISYAVFCLKKKKIHYSAALAVIRSHIRTFIAFVYENREYALTRASTHLLSLGTPLYIAMLCHPTPSSAST